MSVEHYENFPVASWLCPPHLRPAIVAIYNFARTADDMADEGDAPAPQRLADLTAFLHDLEAVAADRPPSPRWAPVFAPLRDAIRQFGLPSAPLADLLSAFSQDVVKSRYADRADLLDYCRRSANPIGRLLLHLYGVEDAPSLRRSDAICTALQLANFWQDLSVDLPRGRLYVPVSDCQAHGIDAETLARESHHASARALLLAEVDWARALMLDGAPLVHRVPGRAGWELRLVVQGGLRILDKVQALADQALHTRPKLNTFDAPPMLWRALCMRRAACGASQGVA